ncbi:MAG: hypothetical protein KBD64_07465 [Gammaproteobacteria bacterium]|nr:hypothetical protein [Gammaproteobacteria bacterium]
MDNRCELTVRSFAGVILSTLNTGFMLNLALLARASEDSFSKLRMPNFILNCMLLSCSFTVGLCLMILKPKNTDLDSLASSKPLLPLSLKLKSEHKSDLKNKIKHFLPHTAGLFLLLDSLFIINRLVESTLDDHQYTLIIRNSPLYVLGWIITALNVLATFSLVICAAIKKHGEQAVTPNYDSVGYYIAMP